MEASGSGTPNPRALVHDLIPVLQKFDRNNANIDNIHVTKNQFTIGRARENDNVICHMAISRQHCILECNENNEWTIKNLSVNGTLLNGVLLTQNVVKPIDLADVVQFSVVGDHKYFFTYRFRDEIPAKRRRLDETLPNANLPKIRTLTEFQELKKKELGDDLAAKKNEQKALKLLLEECLQRRDAENDFTAVERMNSLVSALDSANQMVRMLEETYNFYVSEMADDLQEFNAQVFEQAKKIESRSDINDRQAEDIIGAKMEQWTRRYQTRWSTILKGMMKKAKGRQDKLENKNEFLVTQLEKTEGTLKATKEALKEKSDLVAKLQAKQTGNLINLNESGSQAEADNHLRNKITSIIDEQLSCSICSEIFINPTSLNCSHTFCEYCISSWSKKTKKPSCPICRVRIRSMNVSRVFDCLIEKVGGELSTELKTRRQQLIEERTDVSG
ncbi:E3 ubiquitin-protein ligase rnf8-B-like [Diachasmimorpha longicaudata]|uniref:E3 ubiquitin-protein ligase rnf8-B-like n=1 Tax=Diachasmimorpha longicaudata TaxID=58733 RepID=UPI0030B912D1